MRNLGTNSLFSQTCLSTISCWALLEPSLPSRVEREETLNTPFMPHKDNNGLTTTESLENQFNNKVMVKPGNKIYISFSSPFLYLEVTLTMDLNWKHQHRRID